MPINMTRPVSAVATVMLVGGLVFARAASDDSTGQTTAQTPPPQTPAKPTPPAATPAPKPAPPPIPFPADAKIAYVQVQFVVAASKLGKCGSEDMQALIARNNAALTLKQNAINAQQQKIQSQKGLVSDSALTALTRDLERLTRDAQTMQAQYQADQDAHNQDLVSAFGEKVKPIFEGLRVEKGLWMILAVDSVPGLVVAADTALDLSGEVARRLDAAFPDPCPKKANQ
jgi:Skp family chaperone for outer membrane proteins